MRAKMPPGQKVPEAAEYMCEKCDARFYFNKRSELECPDCGTNNVNMLIPVYLEDDPLEDAMYSDDDWGQGD
jgi:hypothetical protein